MQVVAQWASHSNLRHRGRTFKAEGPACAKTRRRLGVEEELECKGAGLEK